MICFSFFIGYFIDKKRTVDTVSIMKLSFNLPDEYDTPTELNIQNDTPVMELSNQTEYEISQELNIQGDDFDEDAFGPIEIVIHYNPNQFGIEKEINIDPKELECLTLNLYREARNQGFNGLLAVASVTKNRVKSTKFPNTYCGVVYQYKQFSWTLENHLREKPVINSKYQRKYWTISQNIAQSVIEGKHQSNVGSAMHYHAESVNPWWAKKLTKHKQIKEHIFYL